MRRRLNQKFCIANIADVVSRLSAVLPTSENATLRTVNCRVPTVMGGAGMFGLDM